MMYSTAWARWVLSSATLHSVIRTVLCRCITRLIVVADRWPTSLTPACGSTWCGIDTLLCQKALPTNVWEDAWFPHSPA
jgi:hypothetical protein